jgi:hypothetical protein
MRKLLSVVIPLACIVAVGSVFRAKPASAATVIWESGTIQGTQHLYDSLGTGTFTFDAGDAGVPGVDYYSGVTGTWSENASGGNPGTWSGTFMMGSIIFGTSAGVYSLPSGLTVGGQLLLSGPITFTGTPPLPASLTDLRTESQLTVTNVDGILQQYSFSGVFQLTATIPEPMTSLLAATAVAALALLRRRALR